MSQRDEHKPEKKPSTQPPKPLRESWKPIPEAGGADHTEPPPAPQSGGKT
jgi:hypothetical protein